jgi:hypothetical protein
MAPLHLAVMLSLVLSGCVAPRAWVYSPAEPAERPPLSSQTIVVLPMLDERPARDDNKVWLYWVPFAPFGWQDFQRPERQPTHINSTGWQFDPPADFAAALAAEISHRRLFTQVSLRDNAGRDDLVLHGRVSSTRYESRLYSYGVFIIAPALWVVGLPVSSVRNTVALALRLEDRQSGKVLWEQKYSAEHRESAQTLYSLPEDFSYDDMLKELMPKILGDLEAVIRQGQGAARATQGPGDGPR